jgi:hypothetical protein
MERERLWLLPSGSKEAMNCLDKYLPLKILNDSDFTLYLYFSCFRFSHKESSAWGTETWRQSLRLTNDITCTFDDFLWP